MGGPFEARLNLIAQHELESGEELEFGYAALADFELAEGFRLGLQAFGELGDADRLFGRTPHFIGPVTRTELEGVPGKGELQIELSAPSALRATKPMASSGCCWSM